jgi:large subunit ribosomal protein L35
VPIASHRPEPVVVCVCRFFAIDPITSRRDLRNAMPKLKTHKAAAKRIKVTATGKLMRMKGQRGHLHARRSKRVTEQYDKMHPVSPADAKRLQRLIPYGTT